ncbi:hypothetical protein G6F35_015865 [Rhizopus arrhizus]|nr:hypothetical protein G6F35_015865 [Rhizopus arrhizus]
MLASTLGLCARVAGFQAVGPILDLAPGVRAHHLCPRAFGAQISRHDGHRPDGVRGSESRLAVQQGQRQRILGEYLTPHDGLEQWVLSGKTRWRRVFLLGQVVQRMLHLKHPEGASGVAEQRLKEWAVLHRAAVRTPAVEDVVVVPHHDSRHRRHRRARV